MDGPDTIQEVTVMPARSTRPQRPSLHLVGPAILALALGASGCSSSHARDARPASISGESARAGAPRADARAHVNAGRDYLTRGQTDEAEREFRLALESEPGNQEALAGLGQVRVKRGAYAEGAEMLERATRSSTQMAASFRSLGDAYAGMGQLDKAAEAYRQAVALTPGDLDSRLALAHSLTEIGEYDEAAGLCTAAARGAKNQPAALAQVYRQLGEVRSRQGSVPEAMSAYYRAAELAPEDPEVVRGTADAAVRGGLYAEAATALDHVLRIAPLDVAAKKQLGWVNFKLERYPVAIKDYEAVGDSLGTADRYYLAQAYAKSSKTDRAVELFREVARQDPQNYKGVYCNMAYAYFDANRYQRAIDTAREGLKSDSANACLRFCWAQALDKLGRHDEAIPVFEAAVADPAYAEPARRELERQRRIVKLLKTKDRGN
ncbi:MAG TPA: tetratricopeptide repeat protein [Candidatus Omnitrophota bacterium]|nr:tetratricopeptide repeat protein [Candidatus Omnitrophota bacterium]